MNIQGLKPSEFKNWDQANKRRLCILLDMYIQEIVYYTPTSLVEKSIRTSQLLNEAYKLYPGLEQYRESQFNKAYPDGKVFSSNILETGEEFNS